MAFNELSYGAYTLSDDPRRLDLKAIHDYLRNAYWSKNRSLETIETAVLHSVCIGVYGCHGNQVGFLRIVTDCATYCYLCDLYILEDHRSQGLSKALLAMALNHPRLRGVQRWTLTTRDTHELFAQAGFAAMPVQYHMERLVGCVDRAKVNGGAELDRVCLGYN